MALACKQCDDHGFVLDPVTSQPRPCLLCAPKAGWDGYYERQRETEHDDFVSDLQYEPPDEGTY